jgi:lysophospholipase L1-like esterase
MVPIRSGNIVVTAGDSISAFGYFTAAGGCADQINAQLGPFQASYTATSSGVAARVGGVVANVGTVTVPKIPIRVVNTGVAGITSDDILADMPGFIFNANPDVLVLEIGTNEHPGATPPFPLTKSEANLRSIIGQTRAWKPGIPILVVGLLTFDEQWTSTPSLGWSPVDADTDAHNAMKQRVCADYSGVVYGEVRIPALTYESLHNTPEPGATSGVLTGDGRHPNPTGQAKMGDWLIGSFQVTS